MRDINSSMPGRNRAMIDVDTFRRGLCYAFGEQWMRLRMTSEEFERICNSYTARPHENGRIGVTALVNWMQWTKDLQKLADNPPTVADMDAADDAELEHWIQGQDMDITREGVVTDKDVALAHALLRDHVGKRFGHLQRAFRLFDEDKSGKLSRREMLRVLMIFNMHTTPARVFDRLMEFCEPDADGVDYAAFAKLLTTDTQDVTAKLGVTRDGQNALTMALDPDSSHDAELQFWIDRHTNVLPVHHPGPVTREEIAQAHRMIRLKFEDRFVHLERAFRMIDDDKSGQLGQKEMLRVLMMFNLHKINAKVLDELMKLADNDKDGRINYAEFCEMVTTPTAQFMSRLKK